MKQYDLNSLVIHPQPHNDLGLIVQVLPADAGWDTITFHAYHLIPGQTYQTDTLEDEAALVALSGQFEVASNQGKWGPNR